MSPRAWAALLAAALAACAAVPARARAGGGEQEATSDGGGEPADHGKHELLDGADLAAARIAWSYFERNEQQATGLVASVEGYPSTTLWDLGSSLLATVAARDLGLLDVEGFDRRVRTMLGTVAALPLFEGELPNKAYDTRTGAMTDYANVPAPDGIGFSAVDLGRFVAALEVLAARHPEHATLAARAAERWRWCRLAGAGELHGAVRAPDGTVAIFQEGRLGYEGYAGRALARAGVDASQALQPGRAVVWEDILGVQVRRDARDRRRFGAVDALVTDPFVLEAIELGPGAGGDLGRVFAVQKRRWERTGLVTALGEDHVDRAPWFAYGAIWAGGKTFTAVNADGEEAPSLLALSTKAAFALSVLHPGDPYATVLRDAVDDLRDPQRGWLAGRYEGGAPNGSVNANTNAVVLEALLYKVVGPLAPGDGPSVLAPAVHRSLAGCPASAPSPGTTRPPLGGGAALAAPSAAGGIGPTGGATAGAGAPRPFRLDGSLYGGWRGVDRGLGGGVVTVWPWRFGFVRFGAEATPSSPGGSARLLWGVGWDDWHERTFFLHVDNWGPIRPSDAFATHQAEVNAGYRLPQLCAARWLCLAPVASATVPFAGGPYLSGRASLTIASDWFVMGGIGWTVPGVFPGPAGIPRWRVVYGLGRWSWKPGSLFLTYYDWGPDSQQGNGILALGVNWAL